MATISIEVTLPNGNVVKAQKVFDNDAKFLAMLERAVPGEQGDTPKQRLQRVLKAFVSVMRAEAQTRHLAEIQAAALATVLSETDLEESA